MTKITHLTNCRIKNIIKSSCVISHEENNPRNTKRVLKDQATNPFQ